MTHRFCQISAVLAFFSAFIGQVASGAVLYVDVNSANPVAPYTNWSTAATAIHDAVNSASSGDLILVTNGTFNTYPIRYQAILPPPLVIDKPVTVRSVNGPTATIVTPAEYYVSFEQYYDFGYVDRCVYLANGAILDGFTLGGGLDTSGGGAYCETTNCIITNCIITSCSAIYGGGVNGGTVMNSVITGCGNFTNANGGGAYSNVLVNCQVTNNNAVYGGGAYGSTLINCLVDNNNGSDGGGGGAYLSTLVGCTVSSNVCSGGFVIPNGDHSAFGAGLYHCTASFCRVNGNSNGGAGGGAASSSLSNCVINGNQAFGAGGAVNCTLYNCIVNGNYGFFDTGGIVSCTVFNSILSGNTSPLEYAGATSSALINSLICSNFANYGAVNGCFLTNCTIVGNANNYAGSSGVVQGSQLFNSICYFNTNFASPAYFNNMPGNYASSTLNYCCTVPMPSTGIGNITNDPVLQADGLHLSAGSPCRGAGSAADTVGVDIDGQAWSNPPSIGCDEFYSNAVPAAVLQADFTNVLVGYPAAFQAVVTGDQPAFVSWDFGDESASSNSLAASHSWPVPGDYTVSFTAFFADGPLPISVTQVIHVLTNDIPVILVQPTNQTVTTGDMAQFNVIATGSPLLTYQWQFDGTNIAGGTNAMLSVFNVQPGQAGAYSVIVTDPICNPPGQVMSSNAFLTVNAAVCTTPPPGLVSWWKAEGDFTDAVDGNNGAGQNVTFASGNVGQAFAFADGASSVSVSASPTLNIGTAGGLTIECWMQPDAFDVAGAGTVIEWDSNTTNGVQFRAGSNLFANVMDTSGNPHTLQTAGGLLDTNHWQLVALTCDTNSGAALLYIDGNVVASNNFGSITPQTSYAVNIGQSVTQNGPTNGYGGLIDELSIYDRALSQAEIVAIYNAAGAGKCNVPVAPTILVQPTNTSVLPGNMAQFGVVAAGSSPLNYQWFVNSSLINSATNSTLTLSNVDYTEQGNLYSVTISNSGGSLASSNAQLTVIDTAPFISSITNQGVSYSVATVTVGFIVTDAESPASSLMVSGTSSNTGLVPNNQIVFGGTDSNRTVTLTANPNQLGTATITLVVTDPGGLSASNSFSFAVTNAPPQISGIAAQEGPLNSSLSIPFTVSDFETPANQLVVTVQSSNNNSVPTNQMLLSGAGTNRMLTIMPGTNTAGSATVTLTVTDGLGAATSTSFLVMLDQFTQVAAFGFPGLRVSAAAWGDYDNDGKLDLLITGVTNNISAPPSNAITRIYHNDGGVFTNFISLPGILQSAVAWCDYDRDGYLDFAICGLTTSNVPVTRIYHNNGDGTFTDIGAGLLGVYAGELAWGDFNNDGAPDLFISGTVSTNLTVARTNLSKLYRNNGDGTFTDMKVNLPALNNGSAVWADFDNDGNADLLVAGLTNGPFIGQTFALASIFRNMGNGVFSNSWNFSPGAFTQGIWGVAGDFNNDGWLDVAISANSTIVYRNNQNGTFTQTATLAGGSAPSTATGDFDNDGYVDLVIGRNPSRYIHNNHDGTFTDSGASLASIADNSLAAGDFNNDGKLDVIFPGINDATLWQNDNEAADTPPVAPTGLAAVNVLTNDNNVVLTWSRSTDAQTSSNGVSYNVRVGTTPGGIDVMPPLADLASGQRRVAALGNAGLTNRAQLINLPKGTYYWSVQAVDAAFEGSSFATEGTFVVTNSRPSISSIADQVVAPLTTLTVPFSAVNEDSPPSQFLLSWQSSNPNVVPPGNIHLSVPDPAFPSNYVAKITAVTNGISVITIRVTAPHGAFATTTFSVTAMQFTLLSSNFIPLQHSFIACGDYDNDGNLDFLVGGTTNMSISLPITQLYRNLGGGVFAPVSTGLPNVDNGSAAWGDFDNSGRLGLAISGALHGLSSGALTRIYRNNGGGSFTDIGAGLPGVMQGAVAWGDFDNDGRLDLLVTGTMNDVVSGAIARIYRNMGNDTFSNAFAFPGFYVGGAAIADFDGDGFPDIVFTGRSTNGASTVVYRNNRGTSFTLMTNLFGVTNSSVSVGDFNNDGRPDIVISGFSSTGLVTRVYRNNGSFNFTDVTPPIVQGVQKGSDAFGDIDNDGLLDILIAGTTTGTFFTGFTGVYHNTGLSITGPPFTNFPFVLGLPTNSLGAAAWGDFENRGVLDVLMAGADFNLNSQTLLFRNNCGVSNTPPSAPTGLTYAQTNGTIMLAWNQSTDAQTTNSNGLNYQVRIGTTPGGIDVKSPPADLVTGHRRVVQTGDTFTNGWNINGLAPGTYYWSVQAIDTTFAGSPFAAESTFTVLPPPPIAIPDAFFTASNTPAVFPAANLATNDIDPTGLPLTVIAVGTNSASGGVVSLNSGMVTYTPPVNFGGNDTFWYLVSNGQSAPATGVVTATVGTGGVVWLKVVSGPLINNGSFVTGFAGVPGLTYTIEGASNLTGPWTKITNLTAPQTDQGLGVGGFEFSASINSAIQFYRVVYPSY
jgi:hypothetical protein